MDILFISIHGFPNDHARIKIFFNHKHALKYMKLFCRCQVRGFAANEKEGNFKKPFNILFLTYCVCYIKECGSMIQSFLSCLLTSC